MVKFFRKKTVPRKRGTTIKRKGRRAPYKGRRTFNPTRPSRSITTVRGPAPISDALRLKFKYHDSFTMTAAGVPAIHIFQTSLFDPDQSGGGHQPMGFDEYSVFYNRYRVSGIAYKIWFINTSTAEQCDVAVVPKPNTTTITSSNQLWETAYTRPRVVGIEGGNSTQFFKGYMDASRILGISKDRYRTDDIYQSLFSTNPARTAYLHLYAQPSNLSTTSTVRVKIDLTFYCVLFDRHTLGTS